MRTRTLLCTITLTAISATAAYAQATQTTVAGAAEGKMGAAQLTTATATITAIDAKTRTVTLKGEKGNTMDVVCGPEVKNFDQLKVGDEVTFQYYESLTLKLDKVSGGAPAQSEEVSSVRAEPGEIPGGVIKRQVDITAKITAIDSAAKTVTLVGPKGHSVPIDVTDEELAKVKVGDLVHAVYTEALAVSVSRVEVH